MNFDNLPNVPAFNYAGIGLLSSIGAVIAGKAIKSLAVSWYAIQDRRIAYKHSRLEYAEREKEIVPKNTNISKYQDDLSSFSNIRPQYIRPEYIQTQYRAPSASSDSAQPKAYSVSTILPPIGPYRRGDVVEWVANQKLTTKNGRPIVPGQIGIISQIVKQQIQDGENIRGSFVVKGGDVADFSDVTFVARPPSDE